MKKKFLLLLLVSLFIVTSCDFSFAPKDIIPPYVSQEDDYEDPNDYEYEPFSNLDELLLNEGDFLNPAYPSDKVTEIQDYMNKYVIPNKRVYVDNQNQDIHELGSIYFSTKYNTIYVSYNKKGGNPGGKRLSTYDLYLIERHAITYIQSDEARTEDRDYLRAVIFYPDQNSKCKIEGDPRIVNGCADYGGEYGIIHMNDIMSLTDFTHKGSNSEPKRDTFAHEYGHVSTFYHMVYRGNESYESYLQRRLPDHYNLVYPDGLPEIYSSDEEVYKIQPEEVLADDFVELFYHSTSKYDGDTLTYDNFNYTDYRNALNIDALPENVTYLNKNVTLKNVVYEYYTNSFYNKERSKLSFPKVIKYKANDSKLEYYESITDLGKTEKLVTINTSDSNITLIAVEEIEGHYYRVILSSLVRAYVVGGNSYYYDRKDIHQNHGYVLKSNYDEVLPKKDIYKISATINGNQEITQEHLFSTEIWASDNSYFLAIIPFYEFNFFAEIINGKMYDYIHPEASSGFAIPSNMTEVMS